MTAAAAGTQADLRAAVRSAARTYFDARRLRVDGFVARHFSLTGALRLHRHALGWDILRAPANILLAPVQVLLMIGAGAARALGWRRAGRWLAARRVLLETAVMREVRRLIVAELLELPSGEGGAPASNGGSNGGAGGDALAAAIIAEPDIRRLLAEARGGSGAAALASGLSGYTGARSAVAEMTTAFATLGAGAAVFQKLTPGALTLGPALAAAMAHSAAVSTFPLGAAAGSLWYGWLTPAAPPELVAGVTLGLILAASVFAAFAGVIADPVQRLLGVHHRRLRRLIDALERRFLADDAAGLAVREHYLARLMDLMDVAALAAARLKP